MRVGIGIGDDWFEVTTDTVHETREPVNTERVECRLGRQRALDTHKQQFLFGDAVLGVECCNLGFEGLQSGGRRAMFEHQHAARQHLDRYAERTNGGGVIGHFC